jgi:hypothetical protein
LEVDLPLVGGRVEDLDCDDWEVAEALVQTNVVERVHVVEEYRLEL